eukprot:3244532-Rhodomonas_salina.2
MLSSGSSCGCSLLRQHDPRPHSLQQHTASSYAPSPALSSDGRPELRGEESGRGGGGGGGRGGGGEEKGCAESCSALA